MSALQVAIYACVSSEQQADAHTIARQLAAWRARVATDGDPMVPEQECSDAGYSGATLVRPGLERVRDVVAAGGIDRLSVPAPDRLARK
jgi:site-specific DNA recombinase